MTSITTLLRKFNIDSSTIKKFNAGTKECDFYTFYLNNKKAILKYGTNKE